MIRSFARTFALMVVLLPALAASAQDTQTPPPAPPAVSLTLEQALQYAIDHYPTVRAALEQVNASTRRRQRREIRVLAEARFALAIESRHRQQHLRPGAAAVRDPGDVGSGAPVGVRRQRLGERDGRAVLLGAVRLRPSSGDRRRAPRPQWLVRAPAKR